MEKAQGEESPKWVHVISSGEKDVSITADRTIGLESKTSEENMISGTLRAKIA